MTRRGGRSAQPSRSKDKGAWRASPICIATPLDQVTNRTKSEYLQVDGSLLQRYATKHLTARGDEVLAHIASRAEVSRYANRYHTYHVKIHTTTADPPRPNPRGSFRRAHTSGRGSNGGSTSVLAGALTGPSRDAE